MSRALRTVDLLEWHDGVVLGVATLSWRDGIFLVSALSWSPDDRLRTFAVVPVEESEHREIKRLASGGRDHLLEYLRAVCRNVAGEVSVICVDEHRDEVVSEATVQASDVVGLMTDDIEETVHASRAWLLSSRG